MRFSLNWLKQWVATELDAEAVCARLTGAGLEVDELKPVGVGLDGVVVAEIVDCKPHPNADRLKLCQVAFGGQQPATIVCGAPNARTGLKAPLATVGTMLPNGLRIKPARLRGVESRGMLCSAPELGLGDDAEGLLELDPALEVGVALAAALGLPDHEIEIDLTPNRADCLSLRGIAREFAAIEDLPCNEPVVEDLEPVGARAVEIELQARADCPRYVGRVIEGVDIAAETPAWMVQRLMRSGLRSLGPVVDVTNYVLLELGQPMHAFDLEKLEGGIRVRRAHPGDRITLLDGQDVEPDPDMLLICDQVKPVALAGIMGGADTAVGETTRDILLESAWFNPAVIIGRGRRLGLATDSAHRFERGVDPALQRIAVERATALIVEIAGGAPGPVVEQVDTNALPSSGPIELRLDRVGRLLGLELDGGEVASILRRLGMKVEVIPGGYRATPPTARRDLAIEVDLIEEIARLIGYDRLPSRSPGGRLRATMPSERNAAMEQLRVTLQARGFQEIMTWTFVAERDLTRLGLQSDLQTLANPLSQDLAVLRTSLLPGLLRTARANLRHQQPRVKLYETGHVFHHQAPEQERLGLLLTGRAEPENWLATPREFDFFDLKGELEHLLRVLGHDSSQISVVPEAPDCFHPGQRCTLKIGTQSLGHAGQLHPAIAGDLGFVSKVFVAELDLGAVRARELPQYRGVARFPSVRRDLALIVPDTIPAAEIQRIAAQVAGTLLEQCLVFDLYQGEGIESGSRSLAIGLILRDVSRTLADSDVDSVMLNVVEALQQQCSARLRG